MADDPWAAFPVVQPAAAPAATVAAPTAAAAAPAGGGDDWSAFPVVQAAGSSAPATTAPNATPGAPAVQPAVDASHQAPWTLGGALLPSLSTVNSLVRSAANSVPIVGAYADKLDAATDAALTGKSQDKALSDQKAMDQQFATQNPVSSGAAGFAGAAGGSMAMLPEWGLGLGTKLAADGVTRVAAPFVERVVGSAVGGAGLGAADNAVRGDSASDGAIAGGVGGALGPLIGKGIGAGYRGLMGLGIGQAAPAELQGTGRIARGWLQHGVEGMTPEDAVAAREAVGPAGMVADVSPHMLDLAKSVADQNGAGKPIVRDAFQARMDGRNARVNGFVDSSLGPAQSPTQFAAGLDEQAVPLAQQQAAAIRAAGPVDVSGPFSQLQGAVPNAAPGSPEHGALSQAINMLAERQKMPATSGWELDPAGPVSAPEAPAGLPDAPTFGDQAAPSRPQPVGVPRPPDLHAFIRSAGGVQDRGGDLAAMGYGNLIARPGQGLGADAMRQAAAQAGYLGSDIDHATANTTVNDLFGAIGSDNPIHSVFDQDAAAQWAARDAAMADYQQRGGSSSYPTARPAAPPSAPGIPTPDPGFDPMQPAQVVPTTNAQRILSARKALDDRINYSGPGAEAPSSAIRSQQGAYQQVRGGLSQALHDQVPGYSEPTTALAGINRQRDALNEGQAVLGGGANAPRPDDFARLWSALSPEEQAAYRVGMRANVDQALGTRANDFQALKGVTQGPNGWNQEKLGTAFGPDAAGAVNKGIDQETQIARNTQHVIGGSPTNENQQIRRLTSPEGMNGVGAGLVNYAEQFMPLKPSTWVPPVLQPRALYNRAMEGAAERARAQIAPHLVKSGPEADALIRALLAQRQRQGAIAAPEMDPVVRALAGVSQATRQAILGQ